MSRKSEFIDIKAERDHWKAMAEYWEEQYENEHSNRIIEHTKRVEYYGVISKLVMLKGLISCEAQSIIYEQFNESDKYVESFLRRNFEKYKD